MWRERTSRVLVEGHRAVRSAVSSRGVETVLYTPTAAKLRSEVLDGARERGARMHEIAPSVKAYLTSATTAPDVVAVASAPEGRITALPPAPSGIVLSNVRDPAAVGSMLATAVSAGAPALVIGPGCADVLSPKCIRAGQGAQFLSPVVRAPDLAHAVATLRASGSKIVALLADGPSLWDAKLAGPAMFIVAGEGSTGEEAALADEVVAVPATGGVTPSLAAQMAIVMYEWVRQGGAHA